MPLTWLRNSTLKVLAGQETSNRSVGALTSAMDDQKIQGSSGLTPRRETRSSMLGKQSEPPKTTTPTVPESAGQDSMNRKLKFDSSDFARRRSAAAEKAPDAPSFDLCTPHDENEQQVAPVTHACQGRATTNDPTGPSGTSITPVEHAYQSRLLRAGKQL